MTATILSFQPRTENVERIVGDVASTLLHLLNDPLFGENAQGLHQACVDNDHHVQVLLMLLECTRVLRSTQTVLFDTGHEVAMLDVASMSLEDAQRLRDRSRTIADHTMRTLRRIERVLDTLSAQQPVVAVSNTPPFWRT